MASYRELMAKLKRGELTLAEVKEQLDAELTAGAPVEPSAGQTTAPIDDELARRARRVRCL